MILTTTLINWFNTSLSLKALIKGFISVVVGEEEDEFNNEHFERYKNNREQNHCDFLH
jgi:arginyl-tRNA--protein-N-Asp/Glu arginylyltransferase